jgi:trimeric autotransporter adhesin
MHNVYRLVWNASLGKWVVASELAMGRKKKSTGLRLAALSLALAAGAPMAASAANACTLANGAAGVIDKQGLCVADTTTETRSVIAPNYQDGGGNDNGKAGAIALGSGANSDGINAIAIGTNATTINSTSGGADTGRGAIAIGNNATASTYDVDGVQYAGVAMGASANAQGGGSVAIGDGAQAGVDSTGKPSSSINYGVSIGTGTRSNNGAVAIGLDTLADGNKATSLGIRASASATSSVAIGDSASATGTEGVAIGVSSKAMGNSGIALGNTASAAGNAGVALGYSTQASGSYSAALGYKAIASGDSSIALGANANASTTGSVALGQGSVADRANAVSVGTTAVGGQRQIINVAAGTQGTDAVNLNQLATSAGSIASAIGGGSVVNADGSITAPSYIVQGATVTNLGAAIGGLDTGLTTANDNITTITNQLGDLASGTIGLVQQTAAGSNAPITVGANTDGATVNFAGTAGNRVLSGVANGTADDDAVTIAQLKASGLVDPSGDPMQIVSYDDISLGKITLGGTGGTILDNLQGGLIAAGSMQAVNGGQLYSMQQDFQNQFTQLNGQLGNLSNQYNDLNGRVGAIEAGGGSGGGGGSPVDPSMPGDGDDSTAVGAGSSASGDGSTAVGTGATASGNNSSANGAGSLASGDSSTANGAGSVASGDSSTASGAGAVASGNNSSATGANAVASGNNSTAIGQGASAAGQNSTALGSNTSVTANNSVALGSGSVADRDNTVSVGSAGNERQITNVAAGTQRTDAANWGQVQDAVNGVQSWANRRINDVAKNAYSGVAAAMAMPNLTPSGPGRTVVGAGVANYKNGSAIAAGVTYRSEGGNWLMGGAVSGTSTGDMGIRAQVGYEF